MKLNNIRISGEEYLIEEGSYLKNISSLTRIGKLYTYN